MKPFLMTILAAILLGACSGSFNQSVKIPLANTGGPTNKESVATFAEGCFWHTEIVFQSLVGVRDAVSGYAGGTTENPTYDMVSTGGTGHAESVQVYYDSSKISFKTLVDAFFASHDPTQLNRQGNDEGTQYRSIAFYRNDIEKKIIENAIKKITDEKLYGSQLVTAVTPFKRFYPAEQEEQEYISRHPDNPYVQHVSIPDFQKFRKSFKGNFKQ